MFSPAFIPVSNNSEYGLFLSKENQFRFISDRLYARLNELIENKEPPYNLVDLSDFDNDLLDQLFYRISEEPSNEVSCRQEMNTALVNPKITIEITKDCNLKCKYCEFGSPPKSLIGKSMTQETALEIVNLISQKFSNSKISLSFYGGEPFLNFDVLKLIVESLADIVNIVSIAITTNLTIYNKEIRDFINKHHIILTISFDGYKENHNFNRLFIDGNGSYDTVYKNLTRLFNLNWSKSALFINCVISPITEFRKLINYFIECPFTTFTNEKGFKNVQFSFVRNFDSINRYSNSFSADILDNYLKQYDELLSAFSHRDVKEDHFIEAFSSQMWKVRLNDITNALFHSSLMSPHSIVKTRPCHPGNSILYFTYNGHIKICNYLNDQVDITNIGNIETWIDKIRCEYLYNVSMKFIKKCGYCWNASFCRPCLASMYDTGTHDFNDMFFTNYHCVHEMALQKKLINFMFVRMREYPIRFILSNTK